MDFPKSVPGVGLVNGVFVDEDALASKPGSLIPSAWGNAVTFEILNVLAAASVVPNELKVNQLAEAISKIASGASTSWNNVTGKPTTVAGFNITDARTLTNGNFNVAITANNGIVVPQASQALFQVASAITAYRTGHDTTNWVLIVSPAPGSETAAINVRRSDGQVTIPSSLVVPAITGNTVVSTQAPGTNNGLIANTAFVATAVAAKISGTNLVEAGFVSGLKTNPFMRHTDNTVVELRTAAKVDTANFAANGNTQNIDTGEIIQWMEVAIGDIPAGGKTVDITWPFAFPNAIVNVPSIVLRSNDAATRHVSTAYYSMPTVNGCRLQIDEAAQQVQPASLTAIVTARGR